MAGYIGTTPVPQATQHRESFTATGGQTSFATVGYTPQFIDVYLNGVKLAPADFTATNGSDVVLASGATASDILEIVAYTPFEVANQTFTGTTTAANLTVTSVLIEQYSSLSGTAPTVDLSTSNNFSLTTSGNTTFTFSNPPSSGATVGFTLKITAGGTHTLTWPSSVDWAGGSTPDAPASGETDVLVFYTVDGGTTYYGFQAGNAMS